MSLDTRLRDAMNEHVEGLQSPARTTDLVERLHRARARTQRRRTAGTLLAGALMIIGVLAVVGNQSSDSDLTTVADDRVEVEATDPATGSIIDASSTTAAAGPGGEQTPPPTGVDSGSTVSTLPGPAIPPGPATGPGQTPSPSPSPDPANVPLPPTTTLPVTPPTVALPRPCTGSLRLLTDFLGLELRASGTGEPGATVEVTTLGGNHLTTVTPSGTWSIDFSVATAVSITARCSTGEVLPLTL